MKRRVIAAREDWRARVEAQGLVFHTTESAAVSWGEGTYYELTAAEADTIAAATAELHAMCIAAVGRVIRDRRYAEVGLDPLSAQLVERSWNRRDPALYGRMDLAFGPDGVPKLLEYNADTPTSLLEAAVIQWTWFEECAKGDQANALHEQLIARWRALRARLGPRVHFAYVPDLEDQMTVGYLRDTAQQAGFETAAIEMTELGFDPARGQLIDLEGRTISSLFKLYPWEGLVTDALAPALLRLPTLWVEPAWKLVLSTKAILPILWQLFPDHPNLLPAAGPHDESYTDLGDHDGMHPVIGSWLVGDVPAGIGIRETSSRITNNTARFVPHLIAS